MEDKSCFRCGTKILINDINYQMESCSHIYCVNCIYQDIFINSLDNINNLGSFTVKCTCEHGSTIITIDSMEELFSKKYTVDTQEIKEKFYCTKHKEVEKTLFCKTCKMYLCPKCSTVNENKKEETEVPLKSVVSNDNLPDSTKEVPEINEHEYHNVVVAEDLCNKYKEFLKDIQIQNKTANQFIEKFNLEINNYETELDNEIESTLKQIDDIVNKLCNIKEEYAKIIEKKYSNCNKILKIIKLFYANYYLDYENQLNISDVFTLQYLKDVNFEFDKLEFTKENKDNSLENLLANIKNEVSKINIKKDNYINYNFNFKPISRKFNQIQKLIGHRQKINSIIQLNDGRLLTGSSDFKMKFWEEQGGRFIETLTISELTGDILCLYELKDLRIISTNKESGAMKIWHKKKDEESYELVITLSEHQKSVTSVIQLSDEKIITGSKDNTIRLWDIYENSFRCTQIIDEHKGGIYSLCELLGRRFASGSEDKTIKIWEENKGQFKQVKSLNDHKSRVWALVQTNNGYLISGGDKIIIIYKLKEDNFTKIETINAHNSYITKIIKLSDGKIATASRDTNIKIWEFGKNGQLILSEILKGHTHSVYDIIELRDGRLASVSGDNLAIIWKSGKIID